MNKSDDTQKVKQISLIIIKFKRMKMITLYLKKPETKPNAHEEKDIHEGSNDKSSVKDEPNTQPVPNEKT